MKKEKDELLNRRAFFRLTAKRIIPILAISAAPAIFYSCGGNEPDCSDCSSSCSSSCYNSCGFSCEGSCKGTAESSPCKACSSTCSAECSSSCSTTCKGSAAGNNTNNDNWPSSPDGTENGYGYVDLGLSVKWATCNVGASSPEKIGDFLRISVLTVEERIEFYKFLLGQGATASMDEVSFAGTKYDLVTQKWGNKWCTPTKEQFKELVSNCNITELKKDGERTGYLYTSKINRKSILLPYQFLNGEKDGMEMHISTVTFGSGYTKIHFYVMGFYGGLSNDYGDHRYPVRGVLSSSSGNTGCSDCSSLCSNSSTGSSCSNCGQNCSSGCKTTCSGNCPNGCHTLCGGSCDHSCGGTCKYISAGSSCTGCAQACSTYCYKTCTMACSQSCQSCCINSAY